MRKLRLTFVMLFLSTLVFASQITVVGEVFTETW